MPFITEEIAGSFRKFTGESAEFLLQQQYPSSDKTLINETAEKEMALLQGIITQIRTIRSQFNVPPGAKIKVLLNAENLQEQNIIKKYSSYITALAKIENLETGANLQKPKQSATAVFGNTVIYIPLEGLIDFEKENARLAKELGTVETGIANRMRMLGNENFVNSAPAGQVAKAREELRQMQLKAEQINAAISGLK
jgi:valyl-tRNA synthetase